LFFQHQIVQSPSLAFQRIRMTRDLADDLTWKTGLVVVTIRETCNNQWPRCDIAWVHCYKWFMPRVQLFNCLTRKTWYKYSLF
jgi:hypothetical protein